MLDDTGAGSRGDAEGETVRFSPYGLGDIAEMVDRFRSSGRSEVTLEFLLTDEQSGQVPREVAATVYRTVVEALTNVRRHANSATAVRVSVRAEGSGTNRTLVVGVTNTSLAIIESGIGEGRRGGGSGLVGLKERVGALGGTLNAGPFGENGWQVRASVPFSPAEPVS